MLKWIALIAVIAVVFFLGLMVGNRTGVRWTDIISVGDVPVKARPSFAQYILPIFQEECTFCHGPDDAHNGLRLDSYDGVMKGTNFGAVVEPGYTEAHYVLGFAYTVGPFPDPEAAREHWQMVVDLEPGSERSQIAQVHLDQMEEESAPR